MNENHGRRSHSIHVEDLHPTSSERHSDLTSRSLISRGISGQIVGMSNTLSPAIHNSLNFKFGPVSEPSLSTKNTQKQPEFFLQRGGSNMRSIDKSSLMDERKQSHRQSDSLELSKGFHSSGGAQWSNILFSQVPYPQYFSIVSVIENSLQLFGSARLAKQQASQKKQALRVGVLPEFFDPTEHLKKTVKPKPMAYLEGTRAKRSCKEAIVISTSNIYYQAWKIINILVRFISSFHYAFIAAFLLELTEVEKDVFYSMEVTYEFFFFIDLGVNAVTEYHYPASDDVERNLKKIMILYLRGGLIYDLLPLLPFHFFGILHGEYSHFLYLIKLTRLYACFELLDHKSFMKQIKSILQKRMHRIIQKNKQLAENQSSDNNNIALIIGLSHFIRITQLIAILLFGSYFLGIVWHIFCQGVEKFELSLQDSKDEYFLIYFDMHSKPSFQNMIALTYFSFTSLSTVGLGDYHPRSNVERALCAFILLFGVSITSFIMENLNKMLTRKTDVFKDMAKLDLFFGTLEKFNNEKKISRTFLKQVEKYFEYRSQHNKNSAFQSVEDMNLMIQLPQSVQASIYSQFLYKDFKLIYHRYFQVVKEIKWCEKDIGKKKKKVSTANLFLQLFDVQYDYRRFEIAMLKYLEPIEFEVRSLIQGERCQVDKFLFLMTGQVEVGYNHEFFLVDQGLRKFMSRKSFRSQRKETFGGSIRRMFTIQQQQDEDTQPEREKKKTPRFKFPCSLVPGQIIGIAEVHFGITSQFIYKPHRQISKTLDAFFIRKTNWMRIQEETKDLTRAWDTFIKYILVDYITKIYVPISSFQEEVLHLEKDKQILKQIPIEETLRRGRRRMSVSQQVKEDQQFRKSPLAREEAFKVKNEFIARGEIEKTNKQRRQMFLKQGRGITKGFGQEQLKKLEFDLKEPQHIELGKSLQQRPKKMKENSMMNLFSEKTKLKLEKKDSWKDHIKSKELKDLVEKYLDKPTKDNITEENSSLLSSDKSSSDFDLDRIDEGELSIEQRFDRIHRRIGESTTVIAKLIQENQILRERAKEEKALAMMLSDDLEETRTSLKVALAKIEKLESSNINGHAEFLTEEEGNNSQDQPLFIDIQDGKRVQHKNEEGVFYTQASPPRAQLAQMTLNDTSLAMSLPEDNSQRDVSEFKPEIEEEQKSIENIQPVKAGVSSSCSASSSFKPSVDDPIARISSVAPPSDEPSFKVSGANDSFIQLRPTEGYNSNVSMAATEVIEPDRALQSPFANITPLNQYSPPSQREWAKKSFPESPNIGQLSQKSESKINIFKPNLSIRKTMKLKKQSNPSGMRPAARRMFEIKKPSQSEINVRQSIQGQTKAVMRNFSGTVNPVVNAYGSQKNSESSNVSSVEGKNNDFSSYANFVVKRINSTDAPADLSQYRFPIERVSKLPSQIKEEAEESIREETGLQELEQQSSKRSKQVFRKSLLNQQDSLQSESDSVDQ